MLLTLIVACAVNFGGFIPAIHAQSHTDMSEESPYAHILSSSQQDDQVASAHKNQDALHDALHHTQTDGTTLFTFAALQPTSLAHVPASMSLVALSSRELSVPHQPPRYT